MDDGHTDTFLGLTLTQFTMVLGFFAIIGWSVTSLVLAMAISQNHSSVSHLKKVTVAQHQVLVKQHDALDELCKTNSLTADTLQNTVNLLKDELRSGALPPKITKVQRRAIDVYEGIQLEVASQSTCPELKP